jgi:hypothetical protein
MTVLTVIIKKKRAIKALEALRANDLIDFAMKKRSLKDKVQTHLASEKSLAKDWLSKKEDEAWQNL